MFKVRRGVKRKNKEDEELAKKEAKHIREFGESHPINDKTLKLEDKLAKRVFDNDNRSNVQDKIKGEKTEIESDSEEVSPDYYEQLLNVFGKKQEIRVESDESENEDESVSKSDNHKPDAISHLEESDNETEEIEGFEEEKEESDEEKDNEAREGQEANNFATHFFANFKAVDIEKLKSCKQTMTSFNWPGLGSFVESKPDFENFNQVTIDKPPKKLDQIQLKPLLKENTYKTMLEVSQGSLSEVTTFQLGLLGLLTSYKDLYYSERSFEKANEIRVAFALHALNHILKTRTRIISHNAQINQGKDKDKEEYRDQGLTRPKVLIVLPFRDSAYQLVNFMISLLFGDARDSGDKKIHIMNYKRFKKEFAPSADEAPISSRKPEDYQTLFAGNIDDSFRIGLSITKKSLKLYSDFYSSDIIIASPLGLRMIIGADGDEERNFDFLSSIEIAIFDQADVFLMQNWEHVLHIMKHLHLKPKETHDVDYTRVRPWSLELWGKFYCQLVVCSHVSNSLISGFFNKHSSNFSGKLVFRNEVVQSQAAINHVCLQVPQIFHRFDCPSFASNSETRFTFFINKILPKLKDPMMVRTMIYVPSYFDYVRLRNYFRKEDIGFSQICEYSNEGKVAKARHIFFYGGRHFLLFTERFHFYHRYTIKGIRHLVFYEPPTYPHFYSEMVNMMHLSNQGKKLATDYSAMSVTVLFNRYDAHSLVPLVTTKTATSLLQSSTDVHMFLTENAS